MAISKGKAEEIGVDSILTGLKESLIQEFRYQFFFSFCSQVKSVKILNFQTCFQHEICNDIAISDRKYNARGDASIERRRE